MKFDQGILMLDMILFVRILSTKFIGAIFVNKKYFV